MLLVEVLTDALYGSYLIVAIHDIFFRQRVKDVLTTTLLQQFLQVVTRMETIDCSGRIAQAINHIGLKTIRIIDDGQYPIFLLQTLGVEFCLRLTSNGVNRCFLSLYYSQWRAIRIKQYIVSIALA